MKKLLALLMAVTITFAFLTGCGDPVYEDLLNYLNIEMVDVNADYEKIKEEITSWGTLSDDSALASNIRDKLIPLVDGSLEKLKGINPETEEVKAIKEKYVKVMEAYKEGFDAIAEGCETQDEATVTKGTGSITRAVELLDEYNKALETLAGEHGCEIEY